MILNSSATFLSLLFPRFLPENVGMLSSILL
jgi:hypothetical protein